MDSLDSYICSTDSDPDSLIRARHGDKFDELNFDQEYVAIIHEIDIPVLVPDKMPHTSRRARFSKPKPRKAVLDVGDGWSRIEYGYRIQGKDGSGYSSIQLDLHPIDKDLTLEKMRDEHEKSKRKWVESEQRRRLFKEMETRRPDGKWGVKKALCIALGTLSADWYVRVRSVWQFAFFMDMVETLQAKGPDARKTKIFVQDPRFSQLDIEFFKSMGITVLEDPAAEAEVGSETFVYSPCLEWNYETPYLQEGREAPLYVTSNAEWIYDEAERLKKHEEYKEKPDPNAVRMCQAAMVAAKEMRASHHELRIDEAFQQHIALGQTYYMLKTPEEREEGAEALPSDMETLKICALGRVVT